MCTNWFCNMHVLHIERVCGMCVEIGEKHVHSIRQVKLCVLPFDLKIVWNAFSAPYIVNVVFVFFFYSMQRLMCTVSMAKLLLSFFFLLRFSMKHFEYSIFALDSVFSWSHVNFFNFWPPVTSHECACIHILCSQILYSANV